jgi:hypothetical protein
MLQQNAMGETLPVNENFLKNRKKAKNALTNGSLKYLKKLFNYLKDRI